jgi:hypothetical protein
LNENEEKCFLLDGYNPFYIFGLSFWIEKYVGGWFGGKSFERKS